MAVTLRMKMLLYMPSDALQGTHQQQRSHPQQLILPLPCRRRKQNKQRLSSSSSVTQSTFASPSIPPPSQTTQSQIADDGPVQGHVRGRYHRGTSEPTTLTQASTEEFDGANAGPSQATNAMGPGSVATSVHDSEIPSFNSIASKEAGFDVLDEAPKASKCVGGTMLPSCLVAHCLAHCCCSPQATQASCQAWSCPRSRLGAQRSLFRLGSSVEAPAACRTWLCCPRCRLGRPWSNGKHD